MLDWKYNENQREWYSGPKGRVRITLLKDSRGQQRYRLWDAHDWSGLAPGACPTWLGEEWHQTLNGAQREAARVLGGIEHRAGAAAEFDDLIGQGRT